MKSFLLKKKDRGTFLDTIKSLKYSTWENYRASINRFEQFCNDQYSGRNIEDVVFELKSIPEEIRDEAYFDVLQDFVNWLSDKKLSGSTVNMYYQVITYFFSFNGIRVHPIDLRRNIRRPKKVKEKLHPLSKDEILSLFKHTPEHRKMLYLVLIGSGMRIQECVALRRKDFDLDGFDRIKIEIPAIYTKSQTAHTTFVSKEAENFLRPHLESLKHNDLVFATNSNPFHAKMTEIEAFARYRKCAGLIDRYPSTGRHHITLHSFRSYFLTRARRVHDSEIAHAMVGHSVYLGMYDRKDDDERLNLYLKVGPELRIYDY